MTEQQNKEYAISRDSENFSGEYPSIESAHDNAGNDLNLNDGDAYYVGETERCSVSDFVSADDIIDNIGEAASCEVGECAEAWPFISYADRLELQTLIVNFIEQRSPVYFFRVKNIEKFRYTDKAVNDA